MFTGIVEEVGTVTRIQRGQRSCVLTVNCSLVLEGTAVGDSIAVNGVCLTVTLLGRHAFSADVMAETMNRSGLGQLSSGSPVNLERAMSANSRFGGHIVSGHIDGTGTIRAVTQDDIAVWYTVEAAPSILRYVVEKGSIAMDGISLTVAGVDADSFRVSVIPHTQAVTALRGKGPGDRLNLECDLIGKYVEKLLKPAPAEEKKSAGGRLTKAFLREYGY